MGDMRSKEYPIHAVIGGLEAVQLRNVTAMIRRRISGLSAGADPLTLYHLQLPSSGQFIDLRKMWGIARFVASPARQRFLEFLGFTARAAVQCWRLTNRRHKLGVRSILGDDTN